MKQLACVLLALLASAYLLSQAPPHCPGPEWSDAWCRCRFDGDTSGRGGYEIE